MSFLISLISSAALTAILFFLFRFFIKLKNDKCIDNINKLLRASKSTTEMECYPVKGYSFANKTIPYVYFIPLMAFTFIFSFYQVSHENNLLSQFPPLIDALLITGVASSWIFFSAITIAVELMDLVDHRAYYEILAKESAVHTERINKPADFHQWINALYK